MNAEDDADSTACAQLHAQVSGINNGRESDNVVEKEPASDMCAVLSGSDNTSGEGSDDVVSPSVANPKATVTVTTQASRHAVLPVELHCQSVIRDGFLRQGLLESDITAYVDQF
ncbi:hypothetical protein GGH92_006325, partial [Coemansia sp. RSA 2673]